VDVASGMYVGSVLGLSSMASLTVDEKGFFGTHHLIVKPRVRLKLIQSNELSHWVAAILFIPLIFVHRQRDLIIFCWQAWNFMGASIMPFLLNSGKNNTTCCPKRKWILEHPLIGSYSNYWNNYESSVKTVSYDSLGQHLGYPDFLGGLLLLLENESLTLAYQCYIVMPFMILKWK
jgi:hypothetical protein